MLRDISMKKVLLEVGYKTLNYGSALQTVATVKALESIGCDVHVLNLEKCWSRNQIKKLIFCFRYMELSFLLKNRSRIVIKKIFSLIDHSFKQEIELRSAKILKYVYSNISLTNEYDLKKGIELDDYDAVILGSDQVWLPSNVVTDIYTLSFAWNHSVKKITYAPSLGVSNLNPKYLPFYQNMLKNIDYISVREKSAKDILEKLVSNEIKVVLDPVFLLTQKEWNQLIPKIKKNEDYAFIYLLGEDISRRNIVRTISKELELKTIAIAHADNYVMYDNYGYNERITSASPEEFLNLIRNAKLIITDSFHCLAFSIIENKEVKVIPRHKNNKQSTNTRIYNLLNELDLNKVLISSINDVTEAMKYQIDYLSVNKKLKSLVETSYMFIENALRCKDDT